MYTEIYYKELACTVVGAKQPRPKSMEQEVRKEDHKQNGTPGTWSPIITPANSLYIRHLDLCLIAQLGW